MPLVDHWMDGQECKNDKEGSSFERGSKEKYWIMLVKLLLAL